MTSGTQLDNSVESYLNFKFLEPGNLSDNELRLVLTAKCPAEPAKSYVPSYMFKLCIGDSEDCAGHIDLRAGNTYDLVMFGGHIGYSVEPKYRGHHYAARACALLLPLARAHGLNELWITCVADNIASKRTCELAGAKFVEIVDVPAHTDMYREGERRKCRFCLKL
jgi:predicted acetyltransferase